MDVLEFKAAYEWFLLRACFAALAALIATVVCLKVCEHIGRLKAAAERYGWPLVVLFIAYSAWATYTAFPTQEEKQEYLRIQREQEALNNAWGQVFVPSQFPQNGLEYPTLSDSNNDKASNKASNPANEAEDYDAGVENDNSSNVRILSQEDFARGFVLTHIGTNEVYDFTAPEGAIICEDWKAFGAAEDWIYLEGLGVSSQGLGRESLRVHSDGWAAVLSPTSSVFAAREYYPFKTTLGIVPEANWERIVFNHVERVDRVEGNESDFSRKGRKERVDGPSLFWHYLTPSNTLQLTWQNVLYNRESDLPISFQVEFFENGDFTYRYNLSAIKAKIDSGNFPENFLSNITIGTTSASLVSSLSYLVPSLSSLTFRRLDPADTPGGDLDGDGLLIEDELFVYHTDPYNADSDYDGLSDYDEIFIVKSNPLDAYSISKDYYDGFALQLQGEDPFSCPQGSTNTVLEHIFYSGTTNGVFSLPMSTDDTAVLKVNVSGIGTGRLIVGDKVIPLLPSSKDRSNDISPVLSLAIPKNTKVPLVLCADETLALSLDSSDFAFGEMPPRGNDKNYGWMVFPRVKTTEACIHDFSTRKKSLMLPVEKMSEALTCTWHESADIKVDNKPPRSTEITARFDARQVKTLEYTLSHPQYLFGVSTYRQQVRFCPMPPETENEEEVPPWYSSAGGGDLDDDDEIQVENCWCCHWGGCYGMCCGCESDCSDGTGDGDIYESNFDQICPKHNSPYDECAYLHRIEYTNAVQNVQHLSGVLYLRDPPIYEPHALEVPAEHRNCCACPDHWTNYVAVAYKSPKLNITDAEGLPFVKTDTSCTVNVSGVSPSSAIGDAQFAFSRNGEVYLNQSKTVLGVGIKSTDGRHKALNSLNGNFGYPMTVATNLCDAAELRLVTDVKLPTGNIHLEFADITGSFALWRYDSYSGEYRKLLDSETMPVKDISFEHWREIYRRADVRDSSELPIYITSSASGTAKLIFRYWAVIDGKFVQDTAEQRISSVLPLVKMDINYDNTINEDDVIAALAGRVFRFWYNTENVKGDYVGHDENVLSNINDNVVNGKYDLVNFFPMEIDFSAIRAAWGDNVTYRLKAENPTADDFHFCMANVSKNNIRSMQTSTGITANGKELSQADLISIPADGYAFSNAELDALSSGEQLLVVEARQANNLVVSLELNGVELYSYTAPLCISSVREMYRWLNERYAAGDNGGDESQLWSPWNRPDDECDGKHFVFVHGYNVNAADARVWAEQVFKRLWWAGSKSMFTAVDWRGDESQFSLMFTDMKVSPDYYVNVKNAFLTAPVFAQDCNGLPGEKIVLAHSLGNMLVSSAAKDHGLDYSKYYMLNAAVPMEAYDVDADEAAMIDPEWTNVPLQYRASDWSKLFSTNDFRFSLSWRGRFEGIVNAINCYSPTEDVLANAEVGQLTFSGGAWKIQELTKGTTVWHEINLLPFLDLNVACEGGWGINTHYSLNPLWYMYQYGFTEKAKNDLTREDAIIHPLFTPFRSENAVMHSTNLFIIADTMYREQLRATFLADAIPATSFAAGANHTSGVKDNHNMHDFMAEDWPRRKNNKNIWLHSDIKNIAYYFLYPLFDNFIEEEIKQ